MPPRDWTKLRARYGDAREVPRLLSTILDAERRRTVPAAEDDAWRELVVLVHGDGDIYDSTVAVLEDLLEAIARGQAPFSDTIELVEGMSEAFELEGPLGEELRRVLLGGRRIFLDALGADDARLRARTAYILGNLIVMRESSMSALLALIEREEDESVLATAIWALGNVQEHLDEALFARLAREAKHTLPRAVASAWLAWVLEGDVDETHTRAVADALHQLRGQAPGYLPLLPFDFLEGSLRSPLGGDLLQMIRTRRYVPRA